MSLVCVWHDLLGDDADDKVFDNFENSETCVAEMQSILLHWVTADSESVNDVSEWSGVEVTKIILAIGHKSIEAKKFYRRQTGRWKQKISYFSGEMGCNWC